MQSGPITTHITEHNSEFGENNSRSIRKRIL